MFEKLKVFPVGDSGLASVTDAEEFFDDCPICQAQKRALEAGRNVTMEEIEAAGREIEKSGKGVVGTFGTFGTA